MREFSSVEILVQKIADVWKDLIPKMTGMESEISTSGINEESLSDLVKGESDRRVIAAVQVRKPVASVVIMSFSPGAGGMISERIINSSSEYPPSDFSDLHRSALQELLSQAWSEISSEISGLTGKRFLIGSVDISLDSSGNYLKNLPAMKDIERLTVSDLNMTLNGDRSVVKCLFLSGLINELFHDNQEKEITKQGKEQFRTISGPEKKIETLKPAQFKRIAKDKTPKPKVTEKKKSSKPLTREQRNIELLSDVPVKVTGELGKAKVSCEKLLSTAPGTVYGLDTRSGEPIRVLVNDRLVARAQVVSIGDKFGLRIVEMISPDKKLEQI